MAAKSRRKLPLLPIKAAQFSSRQLTILLLLAASLGGYMLYAYAGNQNSTDEIRMVSLINSERSNHGINTLTRSKCLTLAAREWAKYLGDSGQFYHSDTAALVNKYGCGNWTRLGENISYGYSTADAAHAGYINSPCHHANIDSRTFTYSNGNCSVTGGYGSSPKNYVGTAAYRNDGGVLYTVQIFAQGPGGGEWTAPIPEYYPPTTGTILGRIYVDSNGNNVRDSGEQLVQNGANCGNYANLAASVTVSGHGTQNPNRCNPEPYYQASDVAEGSRSVYVNPPSGYAATTPTQTVNVRAGQNYHVWFGIRVPPAPPPPPPPPPPKKCLILFLLCS